MINKPFGGTIEDWEIVNTFNSKHKLCFGHLHDDPNKRFSEGLYIHTSNLVVINHTKNEIETLNTIYSLGNPKQDEN